MAETNGKAGYGLFLVQSDDDNEMFVVARDYSHAVARWERAVRNMDERDPNERVPPPKGVQFLAESHELLL